MSRMFSETIVGVKMRVLEVFLVAVLGCSLAEGRLVSKCELKDQLTRAISVLPEQARQRGLTVDNLVAKIVCHVELASGFNTSAVHQLTVEEEDDDRRRKRDTRDTGLFGLAEHEDPPRTRPTLRTWPTPSTQPVHGPAEHEDPLATIRSHTRERWNAKKPPLQTQSTPFTRPTPRTQPTPFTRPTPRTQPTPFTRPTPPNRPVHGLAEHEDPLATIRPHTRERRNARQPPPQTRPTPSTHPKPHTQPTLHSEPPHLDGEVWTLYGLFQLSDHLVCSDGTTPSPNICGMNCNNLIDDDTSDDIRCVLKIFTNLVKEGFGAAHWEELKRMVSLIYQGECKDKVASSYFADCP